MIVTIDGPAGSGKSTIAQLLARAIQFVYLDTGAMYRACAVFARRNSIEFDDVHRLGELAQSLVIEFATSDDTQLVYCNKVDVTREIRTPQADADVALVSKIASVRDAMLEAQRAFGATNNIVVEGRDTGTVVFPNAEVKVFLTASARVRAQRRVAQNIERGFVDDPAAIDVDLIQKSIEERDYLDSTRDISPLRPADDAFILDTSDLSLDEVLEIVRARVEDAL